MLLALGVVSPGFAQFLRLGPFDFTSVAHLDAIYTTNVEGERESEAKAEREDYYLIAGLDLRSRAEMSPSTELSIDTGVNVEKHFVRDDLDNSKSPFGRFQIASETELQHLTLSGRATWERKSESADDVVFTGGKSGKTRNPSETFDYFAGADWEGGPFIAGASYEFNRERYDKEEFQNGDKDETTINWYVGWQILENLKLRYEMERTRTEQVNDPDDEPEWKTTETVNLDWNVQFLERPKLTYSLGAEKEDTDEEDGEWELTHDINVVDQFQINPRMLLALQAAYSYEDNPEEDDISFTYGARLTHELSSTMRQQFSADREPKETFGSTTDTDSTTYGYSLDKQDLFIFGLRFAGSVTYEINKPVTGPEEKILSYDALLEHSAELSRRLKRIVSYMYTYEDSSIEDEILDEHRVTWSYEYSF